MHMRRFFILLVAWIATEFAAEGATFTVTTTSDGETPGTLRRAILDANAAPGADVIEFKIASGPQILTIRSNLPAITEAVVVDGATQPGFSGMPLISIRARDASSSTEDRGLWITGDNSTIRALDFQNFTSRSPGAGIVISGNSNTIVGCFIGTDNLGTTLVNNRGGILIDNGASNQIGGTNVADRNLISGNSFYGLFVSGAAARGNRLAGNYIGLGPSGTNLVFSGGSGVVISNAPGNIIGGINPGEGNVIAGHGVNQILIQGNGAGGNVVQGNYVGLGTDGNSFSTSPALSSGVVIEDAAQTLVGGTTAAARNVISGLKTGISLTSAGTTGTIVQGNYIGTSISGVSAIANGVGVSIVNGSAKNILGGTVAGAGNVIAGNQNQNVFIDHAPDNSIQGNFIGVDSSGLRGLGNCFISLEIASNGNVVGGGTPAARNVIGGANRGIQIEGAISNNVVQGNFIGVGSDGTTRVGVSGAGLLVYGAASNMIGGLKTGEGNLISGCSADAVLVGGSGGSFGTPAANNQFLGNAIGSDTSGLAEIAQKLLPRALNSTIGLKASAPLSGPGNGLNGILILTANDNLFRYNLIFNPGTSSPANGIQLNIGTRNRISANNIYGIRNPGIPIDINADGFNANDAGDAKAPQNHPVLTAAEQLSSTAIRVTGTLNSAPNTSYVLEFFRAGEILNFGLGAGGTYFGSGTVMTDGNGDAKFSLDLDDATLSTRRTTGANGRRNVALATPNPSGNEMFVSGTATPITFVISPEDINTSEMGPAISVVPGVTLPPLSAGNFISSGTGADPVNTFTGELVEVLPPDLSLGGPLPLFLQRYYASGLKRSGVNGRLGDNWVHNFEWMLTVTGGAVTIVSDRGRFITFTNNNGAWVLTGKTDIPFQLASTDGNLLLGDPRTRLIYTFNSSGQLISIADGKGNALALTYTNGGLTKVEDGLGRALSFSYDASGSLASVSDGTRSIVFSHVDGLLTSVRDASGAVTAYTYDSGNAAKGLLTGTTLPEGNTPFAQSWTSDGKVATQTEAGVHVTKFTYSNDTTSVQHPDGGVFQHVHTASGELKSYRDEDGHTMAFGSNADGQRSTITDRLGRATGLSYHAQSGRLAMLVNADGTAISYQYVPRTFGGITLWGLHQISYPDGTSETYERDAGGNIVMRTDRSGKSWHFTFNNRGQMLTAENPSGGKISLTYNPDGTMASRRDSDTGPTSYVYDPFRRLIKVVSPDGAELAMEHDLNDRLLSTKDGRGNTYTISYDKNGNRTVLGDPNGKTRTLAYDLRDRMIKMADRLGKISTIEYDGMGNILSLTDRNGNATHYSYDAQHRLSAIVDAAGKSSALSYDAEGLLDTVVSPLNETITFGKNSLGYVTGATNPVGQATQLIRDPMQRIVSVTDPLGRATQFGYDSRGLVASVAKPIVGKAGYERNELGLIKQITDLNGQSWTFAYTTMGRLSSSTDPLQRTAQFKFDSRGRLAQAAYPDGENSARSYDANGNLIRSSYGGGPDLQYSYDKLNQLVTADDIAFVYDAEGRVTGTADASNSFGAEYDPGGRLTAVSYNGGALRVSYSYDSRDRLTAVSDNVSGGKLDFSYDDTGRLVKVARANGVNGEFTYDAAGRLTRIREGSIIDLAFTLDAAGQAAQASVTAPLDPADSITGDTAKFNYDGASQINSPGYTYDLRGRLTASPGHKYNWDGASRLTGIDGVAFTYNGLGDILTRTENGTTTRYFYNHAIRLHPIVAERNETSGQFQRYYVWSPDGRLLYLIEPANGNAARYFHFDRVGSTLALTAANGSVTDAYAYAPFGKLLARTGANTQPFLFIGEFGVRFEPAANLNQMRARYYDPQTERFLSRDPFWPRLEDPLALNPYYYVAAPLDKIDPLGLDETSPIRGTLPQFEAPRVGGRRSAEEVAQDELDSQRIVRQQALERNRHWLEEQQANVAAKPIANPNHPMAEPYDVFANRPPSDRDSALARVGALVVLGASSITEGDVLNAQLMETFFREKGDIAQAEAAAKLAKQYEAAIRGRDDIFGAREIFFGKPPEPETGSFDPFVDGPMPESTKVEGSIPVPEVM